MDLQAIKTTVNSDVPDNVKEDLIICILANDERVIENILSIIKEEREQKKRLLEDINLLLSKAHTGLEQPQYNKDGFMQKEITEFYLKNKKYIGHCFKNLY